MQKRLRTFQRRLRRSKIQSPRQSLPHEPSRRKTRVTGWELLTIISVRPRLAAVRTWLPNTICTPINCGNLRLSICTKPRGCGLEISVGRSQIVSYVLLTLLIDVDVVLTGQFIAILP